LIQKGATQAVPVSGLARQCRPRRGGAQGWSAGFKWAFVVLETLELVMEHDVLVKRNEV